ncbi:hypothetical protein M9H77_02761 [Catharanthus roseus]|uniref:Uncharacterized protein n=1 Tax=Catharanthus roseus TaxID=4058 RepID=A0ACC0C981_CATRO|nr:hypothetical protein M9H77_02761 [Catharanthus roseus]
MDATWSTPKGSIGGVLSNQGRQVKLALTHSSFPEHAKTIAIREGVMLRSLATSKSPHLFEEIRLQIFRLHYKTMMSCFSKYTYYIRIMVLHYMYVQIISSFESPHSSKEISCDEYDIVYERKIIHGLRPAAPHLSLSSDFGDLFDFRERRFNFLCLVFESSRKERRRKGRSSRGGKGRGYEVVLEGLEWFVGNGQKCYFWMDHWLGDERLVNLPLAAISAKDIVREMISF